ncbi:MAG: hypothetical protein ACK5LO_13595 [Leucobacter sp.]
MEIERFNTWRQRTVLTELAEDGMGFLDTAEGAALLEQLDTFFAPSVVSLARGWGYSLERADVVHMILEKLVTGAQRRGSQAAIRYAAAAEEPWGYLWSCTLRWAQELWGTRGVALEQAEMIPAPSGEVSHDLTPLDDVVRLCFDALAPRTAGKHHAAVLELLGWLAANPPSRLSYEGEDRVAAHRHCPSLTIEQVTAVMNIAWGGRPRQAETSLMGAFLLNPKFRPSDSPTHIRALVYYKSAMRAGEAGSRMLTDWTS